MCRLQCTHPKAPRRLLKEEGSLTLSAAPVAGQCECATTAVVSSTSELRTTLTQILQRSRQVELNQAVPNEIAPRYYVHTH